MKLFNAITVAAVVGTTFSVINPTEAKEIVCFKRNMSGWKQPLYYEANESGYSYNPSKQINPKNFKATSEWQSARMGDRYDNQQKGICEI